MGPEDFSVEPNVPVQDEELDGAWWGSLRVMRS